MILVSHRHVFDLEEHVARPQARRRRRRVRVDDLHQRAAHPTQPQPQRLGRFQRAGELDAEVAARDVPLLDELRRPYVVTARAKGLPEKRVVMKYPVRAALNPFASTIGYLLPFVVSGSVIVSVVLSLPTVGPLLLRSLVSQDMLLASTIILLLGILTVIGTFVSDLVLMWIDPKIRQGLHG